MTNGWRIDPQAARGAIDRAETALGEWDQLEVDLNGALAAAYSAVSTHGPATAAKLSSIQTDPFEIDLLGARRHVQRAITGTRNAIGAYEHGDEQMAAEYQKGIDE